MSRVDVTLGGKNAGFKKMLGESRRDAKKFGSGVTKALNLGNAMSAANLGAMLIANVRKVVSSVLDEFDRIGKVGLRVDMDPSKVQKYGVAAQLAGADLSKLEKAWSDLTKAGVRAEAGLESYVREFEALGVNIKDYQKLDVEGKFLKLADAYKKAGGSAEAYNAVQIIMGRSSMDLIPLLQMGADGISNLVDSMSAADASDFESIQNFNDQLTIMQNELKTSAGQALPVFFATMKTGWNVVSMILRVVAGLIHGVVGAVIPFFSDSLSWSEKLSQSWENIKVSSEEVKNGIIDDLDDIGGAWKAVGGAPSEYSSALRQAQADTAKLSAASEKMKAKEEAARKKAEKAGERDREKAERSAEQAGKAQLAMQRKLIKKRAEMLILKNRSEGKVDEAKKLERQLSLWERALDFQDRLGQSRAKSVALANKELEMEEKIAAVKQAQQELLTKRQDQAENAERERDGLSRLADGLSGGVDSLQSIGLGVSGARYGESKEVVKLREMAVARNRTLVETRDKLDALEVTISDAEF